MEPTPMTPEGVDLYWIPLGAGGHVVRRSGLIYEACKAAIDRRPRSALYHSALVVGTAGGRYTIESTPVPSGPGTERGVVAGGPVGVRWAGRFRIFRYEVRCWRDGIIPDLHHAIGGPIRVADGSLVGRRIVELAPTVPAPVWGRDEHRTGDMWNSNSLVAWLLTRADVDVSNLRPPAGGRAPGWDAGRILAVRRP